MPPKNPLDFLTPEQRNQLLEAWNFANRPLVDVPRPFTPEADDSRLTGALKGIGNFGSDVLEQFTSPAGLITGALSFGTAGLARAGLMGAARNAAITEAILNVPYAAEGAKNLAAGVRERNVPQAVAGGLQMGLSSLGVGALAGRPTYSTLGRTAAAMAAPAVGGIVNEQGLTTGNETADMVLRTALGMGAGMASANVPSMSAATRIPKPPNLSPLPDTSAAVQPQLPPLQIADLPSRLEYAIADLPDHALSPTKLLNLPKEGKASNDEMALRALPAFLENFPPNKPVPRDALLAHLAQNPAGVTTKNFAGSGQWTAQELDLRNAVEELSHFLGRPPGDAADIVHGLAYIEGDGDGVYGDSRVRVVNDAIADLVKQGFSADNAARLREYASTVIPSVAKRHEEFDAVTRRQLLEQIRPAAQALRPAANAVAEQFNQLGLPREDTRRMQAGFFKNLYPWRLGDRNTPLENIVEDYAVLTGSSQVPDPLRPPLWSAMEALTDSVLSPQKLWAQFSKRLNDFERQQYDDVIDGFAKIIPELTGPNVPPPVLAELDDLRQRWTEYQTKREHYNALLDEENKAYSRSSEPSEDLRKNFDTRMQLGDELNDLSKNLGKSLWFLKDTVRRLAEKKGGSDSSRNDLLNIYKYIPERSAPLIERLENAAPGAYEKLEPVINLNIIDPQQLYDTFPQSVKRDIVAALKLAARRGGHARRFFDKRKLKRRRLSDAIYQRVGRPLETQLPSRVQLPQTTGDFSDLSAALRTQQVLPPDTGEPKGLPRNWTSSSRRQIRKAIEDPSPPRYKTSTYSEPVDFIENVFLLDPIRSPNIVNLTPHALNPAISHWDSLAEGANPYANVLSGLRTTELGPTRTTIEAQSDWEQTGQRLGFSGLTPERKSYWYTWRENRLAQRKQQKEAVEKQLAEASRRSDRDAEKALKQQLRFLAKDVSLLEAFARTNDPQKLPPELPFSGRRPLWLRLAALQTILNAANDPKAQALALTEGKAIADVRNTPVLERTYNEQLAPAINDILNAFGQAPLRPMASTDLSDKAALKRTTVLGAPMTDKFREALREAFRENPQRSARARALAILGLTGLMVGGSSADENKD